MNTINTTRSANSSVSSNLSSQMSQMSAKLPEGLADFDLKKLGTGVLGEIAQNLFSTDTIKNVLQGALDILGDKDTYDTVQNYNNTINSNNVTNNYTTNNVTNNVTNNYFLVQANQAHACAAPQAVLQTGAVKNNGYSTDAKQNGWHINQKMDLLPQCRRYCQESNTFKPINQMFNQMFDEIREHLMNYNVDIRVSAQVSASASAGASASASASASAGVSSGAGVVSNKPLSQQSIDELLNNPNICFEDLVALVLSKIVRDAQDDVTKQLSELRAVEAQESAGKTDKTSTTEQSGSAGTGGVDAGAASGGAKISAQTGAQADAQAHATASANVSVGVTSQNTTQASTTNTTQNQTQATAAAEQEIKISGDMITEFAQGIGALFDATAGIFQDLASGKVPDFSKFSSPDVLEGIAAGAEMAKAAAPVLIPLVANALMAVPGVGPALAAMVPFVFEPAMDAIANLCKDAAHDMRANGDQKPTTGREVPKVIEREEPRSAQIMSRRMSPEFQQAAEKAKKEAVHQAALAQSSPMEQAAASAREEAVRRIVAQPQPTTTSGSQATEGAPAAGAAVKGESKESRQAALDQIKIKMNQISEMQQMMTNILNAMHENAMNSIRAIR